MSGGKPSFQFLARIVTFAASTPPHGLATQLVNNGIHEHDAAQDVFFAQEPIDIESACEQRQAGLQP